MAAKDLIGFGVEYKNLTYKDNWDWFLRFNDCSNLWKAQPTYLLTQTVFLLGGLLTLIHSLFKGGRWPWLWWASVCHGLFVETVCYNLPDIDNFWHSQTPIILLGNRLPIHIICLYPLFIYTASHAVSKFKLPAWAEPFAVGLTVVLIDIPYDIVSVKYVHWTWHDTNPFVYDRHYWVPWTSYYFHATFATSFAFWFHISHNIFGATTDKWESRGFLKEFGNVALTTFLGMTGGVILFMPLYHPMHDIFGIHSEVAFFALLSIYLAIIWSGDRTPRIKNNSKNQWYDYLLILLKVLHYGVYLVIVVLFDPEKEVSMGLHETIGPCDEYMEVQTAYGPLQQRKYLCMKDYNEDYFTFDCLKKKPSNGASWYTICGTPFENRYEYIVVIEIIIIVAFAVFYNAYFRNDTNWKNAVDKKTKKNKSE